MAHKAIIINHWWAGILAALLVALIIGGFKYAWEENADRAVIKQRLSRIETDIGELKSIFIPRRQADAR